ncbi:type IV pilus assembly protein PilM, partial [Salmonella enterica subsp. enterica serovar Enteritidis]|nr:type IV pilus assembly protein PilM [Salmonella enterica subsp. enterica serovar Enteritidis]
MRLFTKNNKLVVGVDITTTAIKMVEITRQQGLFHLRNYGIEPLPRGAVVDKNIVDIDVVSDALARLSRGSGFSSKNIATAVSGSSVISKIIEMEADLTELERESRIRLDADQYIPYPLSEVNLDFEVIGPSATPDMCKVLLVASRTENVDQ